VNILYSFLADSFSGCKCGTLQCFLKVLRPKFRTRSNQLTFYKSYFIGYTNKPIANGDTMEPTNIAYADETSYNVGRYRGIALISLNASDLSGLSEELNQIITQSNISEFKWVDLTSARHRFAAQKMFDFSIQSTLNKLIRIDVLTWDTEDKRHKIQGRDDIANLQRMYYHLFKNVMHKR
jgi:hypothetical protein